MKSDRINRVFDTFHDFDLVDIFSVNDDLHICFKCYWNSMNDDSNPWMHFKFIFDKANLVEYQLYAELFEENDSLKFHFESESDNSKLYKNLIDADIYFNNCEYLNDIYVFGCGGNQDYSNIVCATVKIKINSDRFIILDANEIALSESEYFQLYNDWWDFVKK